MNTETIVNRRDPEIAQKLAELKERRDIALERAEQERKWIEEGRSAIERWLLRMVTRTPTEKERDKKISIERARRREEAIRARAQRTTEIDRQRQVEEQAKRQEIATRIANGEDIRKIVAEQEDLTMKFFVYLITFLIGVGVGGGKFD